MSPDTFYLLAGIIIFGGVIGLAIALDGANCRRRKSPVKALSGTLPPENSAPFVYEPSPGVNLSIYAVIFFLAIVLFSVLFTSDIPPKWVIYGCPILLAILILVKINIKGKKLIFNEQNLEVQKCGILYKGDIIVAKKQSFTIAWNEVEHVDYSRNNIFVIHTTDNRRLGVRPFLYGGGSMRGCNSVEIGLRMDYYARYYGHGENDIPRQSKAAFFFADFWAPILYSIVTFFVIVIGVISVDTDVTDDYDPVQELQDIVDYSVVGVPVNDDSSLILTAVTLDDSLLTYTYECDEDFFDIDDLQQWLYSGVENVIDVDSSYTQQLFATLKDANRGYCMKYIGNTSGKTAVLIIPHDQL